MMPEAAVALATFVIVLLVLRRWTRDEPEVDFDHEDAEAARRFIEAQIAGHIEALAERYVEAGGPERGSQESGADDLPGNFAQDIEHFIATYVTRDSADTPGLGGAVRCIVTLEREIIYALVLSRVQAHLTDRHAA
jgi:hypothetical protein